VVAKIGHGTRGVGKMRVDTAVQMTDVQSVVAVGRHECTLERYIDSKYDIHVYKIGQRYNAYKFVFEKIRNLLHNATRLRRRKAIGTHWKTSSGSAMLEQIAVTEQYRRWVDLVADMFGGLDVCGVEALVDQVRDTIVVQAPTSRTVSFGSTRRTTAAR